MSEGSSSTKPSEVELMWGVPVGCGAGVGVVGGVPGVGVGVWRGVVKFTSAMPALPLLSSEVIVARK